MLQSVSSKSFTSVSSPSLMLCQVTQHTNTSNQSCDTCGRKCLLAKADRLTHMQKNGKNCSVDWCYTDYILWVVWEISFGFFSLREKTTKKDKLSHICIFLLWQSCVTWTSGRKMKTNQQLKKWKYNVFFKNCSVFKKSHFYYIFCNCVETRLQYRVFE